MSQFSYLTNWHAQQYRNTSKPLPYKLCEYHQRGQKPETWTSLQTIPTKHLQNLPKDNLAVISPFLGEEHLSGKLAEPALLKKSIQKQTMI